MNTCANHRSTLDLAISCAILSAFAIFAATGCAHGDLVPVATAGQEPPSSPATDDASTHPCDDQHLYDTTAKACRLYPGGGNGWAGCSQSTKPPDGEACITSTRWDRCDCVCEDGSKLWHAAKARCL